MAQLAMAWVVSNPDVSVALTGASRTEQLRDTVKCLQLLPKLTPEVQKRIEDIFESQPTSKNDHKTFRPFPNRRREVLKY
jgi:aryl-alcohol dehydrogenase-like predicted oxidoreductase